MHCFPFLDRISGKWNDFENFDAQKCDSAKTCCAWAERSVLYNFYKKCTVFPFWREFQASVTILKTLTLKNAIWPKRAAHDLKTAFCTIFMVSALFCRFEENFRPVLRFWELWRSKMRFGQIVLRKTWKERFVQFLSKAHGFPFLERISGHCDDFENFDAQNAIWPKRAAYDLKRAFCTIFMESALLSGFEENFRPVWRFWELWRPKCDLDKTCCAWPEKSVLYNFYKKRTVFPVWGEFQTSVKILRTLTLKNAIWPKRAAHDLKRAFCTIFMERALFSRFEQNFRLVSRFWELRRSEMRFGQNVLRMTWNERFVQFSWKAHSSPVLKRIWGQCDDFENFDAQKSYLAKTCCVWPEKSVLYNFYKKRTVFPVWREFQTSVTILSTLMLKNAIWPKRAAHDLKRAFCTIFMESALLSGFEENFRPVWRFWELSCSKMRFGQNVLRTTWKERFVQFLLKVHCFPFWERISGQCDDFENFDAQKCDLAKTCCAWPEKSVLYSFHGKRTLLPFWREFEASVTILRTFTLKNPIWPKRAAYYLKRAFCTIFIKSALFSLFEENFRPVWRF